MVGLATGDDSGVYRLTDDIALVQTVDMITPVVDDPYTFGQIAAANSLSDVYAMGGEALTAMNILCLPKKGLEPERVGEIMAGGASKIAEAGAALVGGHTIENPELVFGLSVTGQVHPDRVLTNAGAKVGDVLVLTKPLGTGLVNSLEKAGRATRAQIAGVTKAMTQLNRAAAACLKRFGVNALTDVTGFGLLGHAAGIACQSGVELHIDFSALLLLDGVDEALKSKKTIPAGTKRNLDAYECRLSMRNADAKRASLIVGDPQTSGGLLASLPEKGAREAVEIMRGAGIEAVVVGTVEAGNGTVVIL
jgi:selenide,water dikinase